MVGKSWSDLYSNRLGQAWLRLKKLHQIYLKNKVDVKFEWRYSVEFEEGMKLNMGQILSIPFILIGIYFMGKNLTKKETEYKTSH